jgi:hypothetical protein
MDKKRPPIIIGVMRNTFWIFLLALSFQGTAQNPKIKCYFNQPVNTALSTGTNAVYLNTTIVDTLIAYINRAKASIDLCVYNYYITSGDGMDAIATAVNNAYARGVTIRWIGNGSSSNNGWANLNAGIHTVSSPTTTAYGICHNKFVVFDVNTSNANDAIVWTGSCNFTRQQNDHDYNNVIIIQDKLVATTYYNQFNQMWGSTTATPNATNSKFGPNKTASTVNSFTVNGTPVQVYFSPKDGTASHLQSMINTANSDLFFGIYTFTDATTANTIKTKLSAGVAGRGIMDQYSNTFQPYSILNPVMGSNLKVYSNSNYLYHNKIMLIDALNPSSDPLVCTGSFNWSASADTKNDENMVVIHDATIANQYYQSLCKNFTTLGGAACTAVGLENYDEEKQMAIYPNPASSELNIYLLPGGKTSVKINDLQGRLVRSYAFNDDQFSINISDLEKGFYIIVMEQENRVVSQKFLKN